MCKYIYLQSLSTTGSSQAYKELPLQKLPQQTVWSTGNLLPKVSARLCQCTWCAVLPATPVLSVYFDNNAPTIEWLAIVHVFFFFLYYS